MQGADVGPLSDHELHLGAGQHLGTDQLADADVVADDQAAGHAVQLEVAELGAVLEEVVLAGGGKQVDLVVLSDLVALAIEHAGGVVDLAVGTQVGDGTGDDVHAVLLSQGGEDFLHLGAVLVRQLGQVLAGEEAHVPGLGKGDHVGVGLGGLANQLDGVGEVLLGGAQLHVHLDHSNSHVNIPPFRRAAKEPAARTLSELYSEFGIPYTIREELYHSRVAVSIQTT